MIDRGLTTACNGQRLVVSRDSGQAMLERSPTFESGDPDLDRFFKRFAGQNQFKRYVGTTYVAKEVGLRVGFVNVDERARSKNSPASA